MHRRDFLAASCATGLASLSGVVSAALGQTDPPRLPGETDAVYQARVARLRAVQAGEAPGDLPPAVNLSRLPGETDASYQARLARIRAAQAQQRTAFVQGDVAAPRFRRTYLELQLYEIETAAQRSGFDRFAAEALIPALNRMGISQVGVFYPFEGISPLYVLLSSALVQGLLDAKVRLTLDQDFQQAGSAFLDASADKPAFKRLTSRLMATSEGMPNVERPIDSPGRIFQLRTNEHPSVKAGLRKIEMFNTGEIAIFRKTGLLPVFLGQTLIGERMPSLTYMLVFNSMEESKTNWEKFKADPDWQALRAKPEYDDKKNICGTTNVYLQPASYSQI